MSKRTKSVYLTVADSKTHKTVHTRVLFNAEAYNKLVKDEKFQQQYPKPQYYYVKEVY
jgi:hypothetical protein